MHIRDHYIVQNGDDRSGDKCDESDEYDGGDEDEHDEHDDTDLNREDDGNITGKYQSVTHFHDEATDGREFTEDRFEIFMIGHIEVVGFYIKIYHASRAMMDHIVHIENTPLQSCTDVWKALRRVTGIRAHGLTL